MSCPVVMQLQRCRALNRPTPNTATASRWSLPRFPGQAATSWGQSRRTTGSSLRRWWAALRAPWCSSGPTPTTSWASCRSILGGGASHHTPSRPGQVPSYKTVLNTCDTHLVCFLLRFTMKRKNINNFVQQKGKQQLFPSTFTCIQHTLKAVYWSTVRESEMQPYCCSRKHNSLLSHSAGHSSVPFHSPLSHSP